jgi:hypothetical protein
MTVEGGQSRQEACYRRRASEKFRPNAVHVPVSDAWEALLNIDGHQKSRAMMMFRVIEDAALANSPENVLRKTGRGE